MAHTDLSECLIDKKIMIGRRSLRRALFEPDFDELSRIEPQSRRQSSRVICGDVVVTKNLNFYDIGKNFTLQLRRDFQNNTSPPTTYKTHA
jgi:hypothetical protein